MEQKVNKHKLFIKQMIRKNAKHMILKNNIKQ